jgi:hypothetical protein
MQRMKSSCTQLASEVWPVQRYHTTRRELPAGLLQAASVTRA